MSIKKGLRVNGIIFNIIVIIAIIVIITLIIKYILNLLSLLQTDQFTYYNILISVSL